MAQKGTFDDEASAGEGTVDVVTEFPNEDNECLRERGDEVANQEAIPGTSDTFTDNDLGERERIHAFFDEFNVKHDVSTDQN